MNEAQFRTLIKLDREAAAFWVGERKAAEWLEDGEAEVARCVGCWIANKLNLGDDETLVELVRFRFDDEDERRTIYVSTIPGAEGTHTVFNGPTCDLKELLRLERDGPQTGPWAIEILGINPQGIPKVLYRRDASTWKKVRLPQ